MDSNNILSLFALIFELELKGILANGIIASSGDVQTQTNESRIQIGNGVQPVSTQKIFKQGDIQPTYNQYDLAIH